MLLSLPTSLFCVSPHKLESRSGKNSGRYRYAIHPKEQLPSGHTLPWRTANRVRSGQAATPAAKHLWGWGRANTGAMQPHVISLTSCDHFGERLSKDDIGKMEDQSVRWLSAVADTIWYNTTSLICNIEHNYITMSLPNIGMVGKGVDRRIVLSWSTPMDYHHEHRWFTLWLLCSMHTYRLAVGSWRYRQLPTDNRRSSVGVYQTPTRSSALIGAIPPIQNLNRR